MKKIKVLSVFGTRPEAIKMAPLVKELETREEIESVVCVTAQHRQMLDQVLEAFELKPDYDLNIMQPKQSLSTITSAAMLGVEEVIREISPDIVLVHGDTTTSFASALAAFYNRVKIGHVEAGLRTYNLASPFPEEANRVFVDDISDMYFAPTEASRDNLLREGVKDENIYVTGNTAIDALKYTVTDHFTHEVLKWAKGSRLILLTAHRRENLGAPMRSFFSAIRRVLHEHPDVKIVYPVHLNPTVQDLAREMFGDEDRVKLIEPLSVLEFHNFMNASYMILTDSGGVQEEAPSLGKPVLVLRDTTERPEGVTAGTLKLVGTDEENVYNAINELLNNRELYEQMSGAKNPYGDGFACARIVDSIIKRFNGEEIL